MQDAQLLVNLKRGKERKTGINAYSKNIILDGNITYVHTIYMCIDAYVVHNVTYYLSNIYYECRTSPYLLMLVEHIRARCVCV